MATCAFELEVHHGTFVRDEGRAALVILNKETHRLVGKEEGIAFGFGRSIPEIRARGSEAGSASMSARKMETMGDMKETCFCLPTHVSRRLA